MTTAGKRQAEAGQTTPLVMSSIFALTLFVAVVANVGQAVNRRVALQLVADAGAYTGASKMAVGLNNIAFWNGWIQKLWAPMTWITGGFIATPLECDITTEAADLYDTARTVLGWFIRIVNLGYMAKPADEAKRISNYNARDLFPGEELSYKEYDFSPEVLIPPSRNFLPGMDRGLYELEEVPAGSEAYAAPSAWSGAKQEAFWFCLPKAPPPFDVPFREHTFEPWYRKESGAGTDYFVWVVKARSTKGLMFDDFFAVFGVDMIPEMTAAAAAKPVGGSIERGKATYRVKMVPLSDVMPSVGPLALIYDRTVGRWRNVVH